MSETIIRTEKHVTITEAHPYHRYLTDERGRGGVAIVAKAVDPKCPLCRADVEEEGDRLLVANRPDPFEPL